MEIPWEKETVEPLPQLDSKRIAVLPFVNMSPDPNDEYFADGMTEELISTVSRIPELSVIARTSVMGYKKKDKKASEIAGELKVGSLIEGSVRKAGNRVRITVQLIDAASERHLWAESFDRNLKDIFAVQGEVAEKVSQSLTRGVFMPEQRKDTDNVEAYTMYLRAMQLLHQIEFEPNLREAIALLEGAVSKDSGFVRAYAGLAQAWSSMGFYSNPAEAVGKAEAAAHKAVELGPEWAEAHAAMSKVCSLSDRFEEALTEAGRAVSLNPNLSEAHMSLGHRHLTMGRLEEATECFAKAYELDPLSFEAVGFLAGTLELAGRFDKAWNLLERLKALYPSDPNTWECLAFWGMFKKDFAEAQEALDVEERISPGNIWHTIHQGTLYALINRREDAMKRLSLVQAYDNRSVRLMGELLIQNALGNYDEAFRVLMTQAGTHDWYGVIKSDPLFAELRKDPRFAEFCKKVGIPP
jgi:TolB-like protein/Flp pilus assembly protein TadD